MKFLLVSLALLMLVSCSDEPEPQIRGLEVVRLSGDDANDYDNSSLVYVCPGETVLVRWSNARTLDASPADAVTPPLRGEDVSGQSELRVTFQRYVTLTLSGPEGVLVSRTLAPIPSFICDDFPVPLVGEFAGVLTQAEPTEARLERRLRLEWDEGLNAELLGDDALPERSLTCAPNPPSQTLTCTNGNDTFELTATVTADGLRGQYSGVTADVFSSSTFSGTLDLSAPSSPPSAD